MTEFLIGPASSGKTTKIYERIARDLVGGKRVILLVPEQAALTAEGELCSLLQDSGIPQTDLEVLNFTRLCNRVFREFGGISYNSVTRGAKALIMWDTLFSSAHILKYYGGILEEADRFVPSLMSLIDELKAYNVTPEQLSSASEDAYSENVGIADKLSDISILYSEYVRRVNAAWEDPSDDLTRLSELLKTERFFEGVTVYIDSFKGFTPQQYSVLRHIFRQSASVTVALTMITDPSAYCFNNVQNTYKKLKDLADNLYKETVFSPIDGLKPHDLSYACDNLWTYTTVKGAPIGDGTVKAVICENQYKEAEFVAADIHKKLREGARYRDFAVIARTVEDYKGIIDSVFSRHGLPCRVFDAVELSETPIFKLVTSAINVRVRDYALDDVMLYIKTGLTDLTPDECFKLESYAFTWNISGSQWTVEDKWYMNPDGYTDVLTDTGKALLNDVNEIRLRVIRPLMRLHESLDGSRTVAEICRSIYDLLIDLKIIDRLNSEGTDDEIRVFNCLCSVLDEMVLTIGNRRVGSKLFIGLFSIVVSQSSFGSLPATIDEITVGSADLIRASGISHAYVIGLNEDCFPKTVSPNAFFTDSDKIFLETCGIRLSEGIESELYDELYYFYKAVTLPRQSLVVTRAASDKSGEEMRASVAFNRIAHLLGKDKVISTSNMLPRDLVFTKEAALMSFSHSGNDESTAIENALLTDPRIAELLNAEEQGFASDESSENIDPSVMRTLFPKDIILSQSKLDKIALCAMSYQLTYTLKLKEERRAKFESRDTGNLIHRIVEKFFSAVSTDNGVAKLTDEEIDKMIDDILNDYLSTIFGNRSLDNVSNRAMNLFKRLRRTSKLVIRNLLEEFSQSEFVPRFFELPIDNSGGDRSVSSLKFPLPDGSSATLVGFVDRVDVCKKGDKLYVRVVDYKTGKKQFDLEDIAMGINLQMLLYLFSIWKDTDGKFKKALGFEGEIVPSGVLYIIAKSQSVDEVPNADAETIYRMAQDKIERNGLVVHDEEILRLMEKKLEGKYIPVKMSTKGELSGNSLASLEKMGELLNQITDTVTKLATEIKAGRSDCSPIRDKKHDSCKYCPHKHICRNPKAFEVKDFY